MGSKAFPVTWNLRRSWVLQPFKGIESESMCQIGLQPTSNKRKQLLFV